MLTQLLRRAAAMLTALLAVSLIIFGLLDVVPGDAAETVVGDSASQEQLDALRAELGLDQPIISRYLSFVTGLVTRGDLGQSLITGQAVSKLVGERLPFTVLLALSAISLATIGGLILGLTAALRAGSYLDTLLMGVTSLGLAMPSFWVALLLVMLFSLQLGWLPVVGAGGWQHLLLPTLTLALPTTAVVARLTRSSVLDELGSDYVRTARAKGLRPGWIVLRHVLRNSLIPLVTMLGLQLGRLLGGAFIVETIFAWPGLGRLAVQAVFDRDLPVVLGTGLVVASFYLLINFAVDMFHAWLDPRVIQDPV